MPTGMEVCYMKYIQIKRYVKDRWSNFGSE